MGIVGERFVADAKEFDRFICLNCGCTVDLSPLTLVLKPGKYLLICNVPGHYSAGMWSEFEVTK